MFLLGIYSKYKSESKVHQQLAVSSDTALKANNFQTNISLVHFSQHRLGQGSHSTSELGNYTAVTDKEFTLLGDTQSDAKSDARRDGRGTLSVADPRLSSLSKASRSDALRLQKLQKAHARVFLNALRNSLLKYAYMSGFRAELK